MKIIIWVVCVFLNGLLTTIINANGIVLGAMPTVFLLGITILLARTLCIEWDSHKKRKATEQNLPNEDHQPINAPNTVVIDPLDEQQFPDGSGWKCSCGRIHPKFETSCICGKSKFDNTTQL